MSIRSKSFTRRIISRVWLDVLSRVQGLMGMTHRTAVLRTRSHVDKLPPGSVSMRVPLRHRLEYVQRWSPLYDFCLTHLIALASKRFPNEVFIDVGANVGDTVLAARLSGCNSRIVAIEASPTFAATLRQNLAANADVAGETQVIEALVVGKSRNVKFKIHRTATGMTQPVESAGGEKTPPNSLGNLKTVRLDELDVAQCSVLKTDTDGFDAYILDGAMEWLTKTHPVIFAETEVTSEVTVDLWRSVLEGLQERGYTRFLLFDNEGGLCASGQLDGAAVRLIGDLISYSYSAGQRFARGERLKMPIHYFDIALFPGTREALYAEYEQFVAQQCSSS